MKMPVAEATRLVLATVITIKVMEVADKEAGDILAYQLFRPLLVSGVLYSAYESVRVGYESGVKA